jgi:hypothetical protein
VRCSRNFIVRCALKSACVDAIFDGLSFFNDK